MRLIAVDPIAVEGMIHLVVIDDMIHLEEEDMIHPHIENMVHLHHHHHHHHHHVVKEVDQIEVNRLVIEEENQVVLPEDQKNRLKYQNQLNLNQQIDFNY